MPFNFNLANYVMQPRSTLILQTTPRIVTAAATCIASVHCMYTLHFSRTFTLSKAEFSCERWSVRYIVHRTVAVRTQSSVDVRSVDVRSFVRCRSLISISFVVRRSSFVVRCRRSSSSFVVVVVVVRCCRSVQTTAATTTTTDDDGVDYWVGIRNAAVSTVCRCSLGGFEVVVVDLFVMARRWNGVPARFVKLDLLLSTLALATTAGRNGGSRSDIDLSSKVTALL